MHPPFDSDARTGRLTALFGIRYPIVQAGMVWNSGWRLAAAVSEAGGLGLIGSGSMDPDTLRDHIRKCRAATKKPFGVNVPLLYAHTERNVAVIREEKVPIVFTSAGNPKTWTGILRDEGITVVHVVSSTKFARKAEEAGCQAVVAEGFEAGGHNGREETTSFVLWPAVAAAVSVPVIAAGGLATGRQLYAAMVLGAEGGQFGTRFLLSRESSSHPDFKRRVAESGEGDTMLTLKALTPVRMLKNPFAEEVFLAEARGAGPEELRELLGRGRAKKGMFEGDLIAGELEAGQIAATISDIPPAGEIVKKIWAEFRDTAANPVSFQDLSL